MAVLSVQDEFQSGDNVTATNLNNLVKDASFNADTTDNSTLEVHTSGYLKVKDAGVQTQHIGDDQVTYGKMQDVAAYSVIGNNTNATATPTAIAIDDLKDNISNATTSADGLMSSTDKNKLDGIAANANNYSHPTGDGNLHVPATGTTNDGKVLTAGATAGSLSWTAIQTGVADGSVTTAKLANNAVTAAKITATDTTFNISSAGDVGVGVASESASRMLLKKDGGNNQLLLRSNVANWVSFQDTGAAVDKKLVCLVSDGGNLDVRQLNDDNSTKAVPLQIDTNGDLIITGDIKKGGSDYALRKASSGLLSTHGTTTVANGNKLTFQHNLNTKEVQVSVYVGNSTGSNLLQLTQADRFNPSSPLYVLGVFVEVKNSSQVEVTLGSNGFLAPSF